MVGKIKEKEKFHPLPEFAVSRSISVPRVGKIQN
jgi:hypothetical protein